jgi:GT2 family glycosyltransferase/glycosyltransferase involved in cell wall biosynthesis/SAM-dependent methyltransferase
MSAALSTPLASSAAANTTPPLLNPKPDVSQLDYDLLQRYSAAAEILDRMLATSVGEVRILEVGPNYLNPLPLFLDPARLQLSRCDVLPIFDDPHFIQVDPDQPLPFANDTFDAVIALEVLEHMPADRRKSFVADCLRVARHGAVFSCPNGVPEVMEAEAIAFDSYAARHGSDHPYLEEHRRFGLPRPEDVLSMLAELDIAHAVLDNAPLETWLPLLLLAENLHERNAPPELQRRLNGLIEQTRARRAIPYRKIYVCAKSFDATAALEKAPSLIATENSDRRQTSPAHHVACLAAEALVSLERDHANYRFAEQSARNLLQGELDAVRAALREQEERYTLDVGQLRDDLAQREMEMLAWRRRQHMLYSYGQSLRASQSWQIINALGRLLRSRGFDRQALIPWHNIGGDPRGEAWQVTGPQAHFIVPCFLPAGWLRIRVRMTGDQVGKARISFDNCDDGADTVQTETIPVFGRVDRDYFVELTRPVVGLRFFPLDVPGTIEIEQFEITALSHAAAFRQALGDKFGLLKKHGLLARSLWNGAGLLARGRFSEFSQKLHGALVYPKHAEAKASDADGGECQWEHMNLAPRDRAPAEGGGRKLDIVYVLRSAGLCGGVKVVLEHSSRLHARGHNVAVYYLDGNLNWFPWRVPAYRFNDPESLRQALKRFRGIKVATWYETAPWVAKSLQAGDRGYYLIQDIEESYCSTAEDAALALKTYSLGLKPITEGLWVREQLKQRFGLDSVFVSIGLDHDLFRPRLALREPQRILTQCRTWSGGVDAGAKLKGWDTARDTIIRCHEQNPRTLLTTFSIEDRPPLPHSIAHIHLRSPSDDKLAELYSQAGVYLLTSNHEGFGLTAAEAMACGCPVVATRAQGNEEFCIDGVTALTAPAGDVEQLARHCLRLQTEPRLARELTQTAQEFIRTYTWDRVIDRLEREFLDVEAAEVVIAAPRERVAVAEPRGIAPVASMFACRNDATGEIPRGQRAGEYPYLKLRGTPELDWSIIIPTIGKVDLVRQCITTCRQHIPAGASLEFIVVDDGTEAPEEVEELRRAAGDLSFQLLSNHQNLGFSASVNHGMRHARGRHIVLCNNDILFFQPWLEPLARMFNTDANIGIVGAKLLYRDGTIQHAGMEKGAATLKWHHSWGRKPGDHPQANQTRYVWSVTGALFAMRREIVERLGGFSTAYATAYEDLDYCLYAWANGIRVAYCTDVVAYHLEGETRGATEEEKKSRPLWAERERAGCAYFEKKWAFLRHVEDFQALLSLMNRGAAEFPVFAEERVTAASA